MNAKHSEWEVKPAPVSLEELVREAVSLLSGPLARDERFSGEVLDFVVSDLTPDERDYCMASYGLGGAAGLTAALDARFGKDRWIPFRFVRLLPPRAEYLFMRHGFTFRREAGWCKVGAALALDCVKVNAEERQRVFEVTIDPPVGRVAEHG